MVRDIPGKVKYMKSMTERNSGLRLKLVTPAAADEGVENRESFGSPSIPPTVQLPHGTAGSHAPFKTQQQLLSCRFIDGRFTGGLRFFSFYESSVVRR